MFDLTALWPLQAAFALFDSDSNGGAYAGLVLLASGFLYYALIYRRYRNQDKRHRHERETRAAIENVQVFDQFRQHRKGLRSAAMVGRNDELIEGALNVGGEGLLSQTLKVTSETGIDISVGGIRIFDTLRKYHK
ncbi:MAG: hypothetical protein LBO07_06885 [Coriobacteriales bacterium]|jgi:hypothetical protein|nr:hypothetical protein [Coriobacteriales bacterium]